MEEFYVSDHHLDHYNIIAFGGRPYKDCIEMNESLLQNHNEVVKPQDHVSFLGDVTLRRGGANDKDWFIKEIKKYNGHKRLYLGNHDHFPIKVYLEAGFEKIYATWRDQYGIIFSHIPLHPSAMSGVVANVHGHIHQNKSPEAVARISFLTKRLSYAPYVNVCVENTNYFPISRGELNERISKAKGEWEGEEISEEVLKSPLIRI